MAKEKTPRSARVQEERSLREDRCASDDSDDEADEENEAEEDDDYEAEECDVRPRATAQRRLKAFVALERLCGRVFEQPWAFVRETLELVVALVVLVVLAHGFYVAHEAAILDFFAPAVRLSQDVQEAVQRQAASNSSSHRFPRLEKHKVMESMQRPR